MNETTKAAITVILNQVKDGSMSVDNAIKVLAGIISQQVWYPFFPQEPIQPYVTYGCQNSQAVTKPGGE